MRNIIICCDGTGNEISQNISNVLKLYRCLRKTEKTSPRQLVYYDPGVGTLERPDPWHKLKQAFNAILALATGYGLDDNLLAAHAFLVHNYQSGHQPLRRRLGYGGQRDRATGRSLLLAEPGGAGVHASEPERANISPGDLDGRAALHVPPQEMGRSADLQAQPLQRCACRAAGYS